MTLYDFLSGAVTFGFLVCALFFLRFWRRTACQLFLAFALAFGLLGPGSGERWRSATSRPRNATRSTSSGLRPSPLILIAILRKNRGARRLGATAAAAGFRCSP